MISALARSMLILTVLVAGSCAASRFEPRIELAAADTELAELVPQRFGDWAAEDQPVEQVLLVPNAVGEPGTAQSTPYDDVLMRTYRRDDGARVMVALAYGRRQTQEIKIHRPELCYYAQGFEVRSLGPRAVRLDGAHGVESLALVTRNRSRTEVVSYWIRIGERLANGAWDLRWTIFRDGLQGRVPDGLLVRVSSFAEAPHAADAELELQHAFLADLYRELPPSGRRFFAGSGEVAL